VASTQLKIAAAIYQNGKWWANDSINDRIIVEPAIILNVHGVFTFLIKKAIPAATNTEKKVAKIFPIRKIVV